MRRLWFNIFALLFASGVQAQTELSLNNAKAAPRNIELQKAVYQQMLKDTVTLKTDDKVASGKMTSDMREYSWGLHKGLNASVDLSVFATFGSHVPHHGGFGQNINLSYLEPLTKDGKLWLNVGGYFNNINYGGTNYHDVGLYGMLGYQFNEHWEATVYGQLSVSNNYDRFYGNYWGYGPYGYGYLPGRLGMPFYGFGLPYGGMYASTMGSGMGVPGANVVGASVRYNVNKNFSLGINVEGVWYQQPTFGYGNSHFPPYY